MINAAAKETTPALQTDLPDGTYTTAGDLQIPVTVEDGRLSVTLPPLSVSYIIL